LTTVFIDYLDSLPQFIAEGIVSLISSAAAGLVIAFVATFYLKKRDERTRVAGVVLEKRVNCGQEILFYLERLSYHRQLYSDKEQEWYELLQGYDLTLPHGRLLQYSDVFSSYDQFQDFFKGLEETITRNKLWMDKKVRFHLSLMQGYFAQINAYLVTMTRIPLPENKQLSDDEFKELASILLLQIGITLDHEVNGLLAHLETLIVESVYKLHLTRPRRSLTRNGMLNMDMIKIAKTLDRKTLWGTNKEKYFALLLSQICAYKDVDLSESDFENMIKSAFAEV
jgi:hypothetical protein